MQISKEIRVDECISVDIELSLEDVCSIYKEEPQSFRQMLYQISRIGKFLNVMPKIFLKELNKGQREMIIKFFEDFIKRIKSTGESHGEEKSQEEKSQEES